MTRACADMRGTVTKNAAIANVLKIRRIFGKFVISYRAVSASLLGHVEQDQTAIFVRNGGAHPHVAQYGRHHARWKLLWSGVATSAVRMETVLAFNSHAIEIRRLYNWCR